MIVDNDDKEPKYFIMASDGLWDACSDDEAVKILIESIEKESMHIFLINEKLIE